MAKKWYVVWVGTRPGIYETWDECKQQVDGYPNGRFKSFTTKENAEHAFLDGFEKHWGVKNQEIYMNHLDEIILESIVVDATCEGNPRPVGFRGYYLKEKRFVFDFKPVYYGTNNIGEFLAIVEALKYLKIINSNKVIYSDSKLAIYWVSIKKCYTDLPRNPQTESIFKYIDIALEWLLQNDYKNEILFWSNKKWGENPADYGKKK